MELTETQCVERGVVLLDEKLPGWEQYIDWDILDVYCTYRCIVGQLRESYGWDVVDDALASRHDRSPFVDGWQYGFDGINGVNCNKMNAAWQAWNKARIAA